MLPIRNNQPALTTDVIEALLEARELIPQPGYWGVYAYDDGPVIAGGGIGSLLWFPSRERMHDLLSDCTHHHLSDRIGEPLPKFVPRVETRIPCDDARRVEEINSWNQHLKGFLQIAWFGEFTELVSGESDFAHEVRIWFRSKGRVPTPTDKVVDAAEQLQFAETLQDFGL